MNPFKSNPVRCRSAKRIVSGVTHWIAVVCCALLLLWFFLMCCGAFSGALDDFEKFNDLGFSYSLGYHLAKNSFCEQVALFVCLGLELTFYFILHCQSKKNQAARSSIWYFSIVLLVHIFLVVFANSPDLPNMPPYTSADLHARSFHTFASITVFPAFLFFLSYILQAKLRKAEE